MMLKGAMGAAMAFKGGTDKEALEAYVEHFLTPTLKRGQIVMMDWLGAHRAQRVRRLIEERGAAKLWFLPSYSPDLNRIEEAFAFSKVKALLIEGGGAHARGAFRGHSRGALGCHAPRRARMVRRL